MDYIRSSEIYSVVLSPFQLRDTCSVTHSIFILYCKWSINVTLRSKAFTSMPPRCHPKQHVIAVWNSFIVLNIWICVCVCVCVCVCMCVWVCYHCCVVYWLYISDEYRMCTNETKVIYVSIPCYCEYSLHNVCLLCSAMWTTLCMKAFQLTKKDL